jgi:hypothetical protein
MTPNITTVCVRIVTQHIRELGARHALLGEAVDGGAQKRGG